MSKSRSLSELFCQTLNLSSNEDDDETDETMLLPTSRSPMRKNVSFGFPLKIRDEKTIDLRSGSAANYDQLESSEDELLDPTQKLYPLEEFDEDTSRASSKMNIHLKEVQAQREDVRKWLENRHSIARAQPARPTSRRGEMRPFDMNAFVIHQNSDTSIESYMHSDIDENFHRSMPRQPSSTQFKDSDVSSIPSASKQSFRKSIGSGGDCRSPLQSRTSSPSLHKAQNVEYAHRKLTDNEIADWHARNNLATLQSLSRSEMELKVVESARSLLSSSSKSKSCFWRCLCGKKKS